LAGRAWVTTYLEIANGELDVVSDTVPRLTGYPATSLSGYLAAHPESYQHLLPKLSAAAFIRKQPA
jgi:NAD(P)H dehydrogenase (quinone)